MKRMEKSNSDTAAVGMPGPESDFEEHLQRCLSMVLHHQEIQQIADVILRVQGNRVEKKAR